MTYLIPGCVGRGVRLGSEGSSVGGGGVWKSGNHEIWSEMGPYGSIWLDTAAKMIVRTLRIFFVFKKSLNIMMDLDLLFNKYEIRSEMGPYGSV